MIVIKNLSKYFIPLTLVTLLASVLFAGTTGKIAGVARDAETGAAMPGINIVIEGTFMGAAADEQGRYFIINIPVGAYTVRADAIGYKTYTVTNVEVTIDHTTTQDFNMESTVIEGETVTVIAERPLIRMDNTATRVYITADDITGVAAESISELIALEAGTVGANVRGGRASGTVFFIDGISMRNPFTGYGGQSMGGAGASGAFRGPALDMSITTELPEFAFQEVEMLTGGYSPEYGNAQDAVINIATKEGGSSHHGIVRVTTEGALLSDWNGVEERDFLINPDLALPPATTAVNSYGDTVDVAGGYLWIGGQKVYAAELEDIHDASVLDSYGIDYAESTPIWTMKYGDFERQKISYSFSGPLFGNAYYAISGEWLDQPRGAWGENTERTNNNFLAKLTYQLNERTKLNLSVLSSKQQYDAFSYGTVNAGFLKYRGGYLPGYGPLYPSVDMIPQHFKDDLLISGQMTHSLNANSYINVSFGRYSIDYEQKIRDYDDRDGDGDRNEYLVFREMEVKSGDPDDPKIETAWRFTDEDESLGYIWTQNPSITNDTLLATYDSTYAGEWKIGNVDQFSEANQAWSATNKTGWKEIWRAEYDPSDDSWTWIHDWLFVNGDNEFELEGVTLQGIDDKIVGVSDAYYHIWGDQYSYASRNSVVTTLKVDYANQVNPVHFLQTGLEYVMYDMDQFGISTYSVSNFYVDEWDYTPTEWGAYFRDKIEMGGLIVNAGLRLDSYNLGDDVEYSAVAFDPDEGPVDYETGEIVDPVTWDNVQLFLSPRLGISHPITDRDVLHFSYNHFLQRPDWRYFFENLGYSTEGAYEEIGNPDIEPQRTVTYEVGFTHQFTDNSKVDVTAYYKDIFGWIQQSKGGDMPGTSFWIYGNADFGNAKGFEISFDKRFSNYYAAAVNYTYMLAEGRLSDPGLGGTYIWRNLVIPRKVNPMDYDQRHTLNVNVNFHIPASNNPLLLFGDWRVNVTNRFGSGLPFDSQSRASALTVPPENDERRPFTNELDLRVVKRIAFGPGSISAWMEVFNLLDRKNLGDDPVNAEWYLSDEDRDGNGVADHLEDATGRRDDFTVWNQRRRVKVGIDLAW